MEPTSEMTESLFATDVVPRPNDLPRRRRARNVGGEIDPIGTLVLGSDRVAVNKSAGRIELQDILLAAGKSDIKVSGLIERCRFRLAIEAGAEVAGERATGTETGDVAGGESVT